MAFSKETRIKIFIIIDVIFFLIEIIIGMLLDQSPQQSIFAYSFG